MSLATIFQELSMAIQSHGRCLTLADEVQAVVDRHDMLIINRGDGNCIEADFGIRRGGETILGHFFMYPQVNDKPAHVAYDIDWTGIPSPPGQQDNEKRSWFWDIELAAMAEGQDSFDFPIHQ